MDFLTEHAPLSAGVLWWCWGAMYLKHSVFNALSAQGTVLHLYCTFHADVPKNEMKSEISDDWQAWGEWDKTTQKAHGAMLQDIFRPQQFSTGDL